MKARAQLWRAGPDPERGIDRLALERAVADLPAGYRLIFILHDVEGYEHNEIAAMLECSIGNSKSQLHKARLRLRDALRADPQRRRSHERRSQQMSCAEFQAQLPELIGSGADAPPTRTSRAASYAGPCWPTWRPLRRRRASCCRLWSRQTTLGAHRVGDQERRRLEPGTDGRTIPTKLPQSRAISAFGQP